MKYKTAFRLGVKLIGLLLIGSSIGWATGTCIAVGYTVMTGDFGSVYMSYQLSGMFQQGIGLVVGLYLFFGGRWITDLAIPSNRPYCHECGYELTGLPGEGRCPECGTEYRRSDLEAS